MVNTQWEAVYENARVAYLNEGEFDHTPCLISFHDRDVRCKKPFKYFTMWKTSPQFDEINRRCWSTELRGNKMYKIVQRLKAVKQELKLLNKTGYLQIEADVIKVAQALDEIQTRLHSDPGNVELANVEVNLAKEYKKKHQVYMSFLRQKAKVSWLKDGDDNTAIFHQSIKQRRVRNSVYGIYDMAGVWQDTQDRVKAAFLEYYTCLLGTSEYTRPVNRDLVRAGTILTQEQQVALMQPYTAEEVKKAMFSIDGNKAPGPDGFGSSYYKDAWATVGTEITGAVLDFFEHGKLLKAINTTQITLIPKISCPKNVSDFRPISCCNTIYKCITKMICNRMSEVLPSLI